MKKNYTTIPFWGIQKKEPAWQVKIIGWYPPPYGGVSIHVKRLMTELEKIGIDSIVYDVDSTQSKEKRVIPVKNFKWWVLNQFFEPTKKNTIFHNHLISWKQRVLPLIFKVKGVKIIYTLHSFREEVSDLNFLNRLCKIIVLSTGDHFIVVSQHIQEKLLHLGVNPNKISIIPGYIPPQINSSDVDKIPANVISFINNHSPIITANASRIGFFHGVDLYGIDLCISLTAKLIQENPHLGFVFCLPRIENNKYFTSLLNQLCSLKIEENFIFVTDPIEYYPILARSDIFVRPTSAEGDSISIREAISFRIPVVCSDLAGRPENVTLFKNRDLSDFIEKTKQVISKIQSHSYTFPDQDVLINSTVSEIIKTYHHILKI